jgi:hypothetical protein
MYLGKHHYRGTEVCFTRNTPFTYVLGSISFEAQGFKVMQQH